MRVCKRSIITSSLLAILAISSAYGATPTQPSENSNSAVVDMNYANIPELRKSIESTTPAIVQSTLDASKGKPTNGKPVYSTVTMSGNRVVSVKTYKSKEEQEKAMIKERERLDKVTAERRAKRKNEIAKTVFKLPSHQLQAGDPQYEIAKLMYQDLTNKKFDE